MSFQEPADAVAWCLASQQVGSTYRQPSSARTPAGKDMAGPSPHPTCPEDQAAGCAADTSAAKHLLVARLSEKASSTCRPAVRQGSTAHSSARAARHHCSLLNTTSGKAEPCSPALRMPAGSHQLQLACGSAAAPSDHNQDPGEPEPGERLAGLHMDSMQWRPAPSCQGTASRAWHGVQQLAASTMRQVAQRQHVCTGSVMSGTGQLCTWRCLATQPPCTALAMLAAWPMCGCRSLVTQPYRIASAVLSERLDGAAC